MLSVTRIRSSFIASHSNNEHVSLFMRKEFPSHDNYHHKLLIIINIDDGTGPGFIIFLIEDENILICHTRMPRYRPGFDSRPMQSVGIKI